MSKVRFSLRLEHLKRIQFVKSELKKKVLKSICANSNIKNSIRFYSSVVRRSYMNMYKVSSHHKICLIRGRHRGVFRKFSMSRHALKNMNYEARIQNIKTVS